MKHISMAVMLIGALALTACDRNSRFGDDAASAGAAGITPGSASDPT